ncbi:MAG: formate dehydrogenase accessory sulfurtransferase FdhD [Comamonadaceae bacterium]|nr:MAG: formate dehydrogenase accessory sulfurtransferase FdhD [Comamonadaceae bacterium]
MTTDPSTTAPRPRGQARPGFEGPSIAALATHTVRVFGERGLPPQGDVRTDTLAAEVPVALVFNGISHAVMMATPRDLEDFALGFALSEGILERADECRGVEVVPVTAGEAGLPADVGAIELHLDISSRSFERLKGRRRSLAGRTGCGVCGVESFTALDLAPTPLPAADWLEQVDLPTVLRAIAAMPARQVINAQAGAVHAAGWATLDGELTDLLEDVGRHNALDKLLGRLAREGRLARPGFVVMSSRASHELVRKCARLGVSALATISAPTSLGIRVAELAGLRLWGLCRAPRAVLYAVGGAAGAAVAAVAAGAAGASGDGASGRPADGV